jgi:mannose-6-phosphate isomerase
MTLAELWTGYRVQVFGPDALHFGRSPFPLLIKVLDCDQDLSIQVHPPAQIAAHLGGEPKDEMWYVVAAAENSRIIAGLQPGVTPDTLLLSLQQGTILDHVHVLKPHLGDAMLVPSGRLHALGRGLLVYEVQQNSDTTYRLHDWNRVGLDGHPRELHIDKSMQSIDFTDNAPQLLHAEIDQPAAQCAHFRVTRRTSGTPRILMALETTTWGGQEVTPGRVAIWPACLPAQQPEGEWLEIQLPEAN